MQKLSQSFIKLWYQKKLNPLLWPLVPFSLVWNLASRLRRSLYAQGIFKKHRFKIPIVVVGNLTIGGTGKTPLVIHLAKLLKQHGFHPGIVSRGYRALNSNSQSSSGSPVFVNANSDPNQVGDEPVLLAKRLFCPIVVDPKRIRAVQSILDAGQVDVIISDDGLQHYAMDRDVEIIVIDGKRRFGNEWCLPAGPLREPVSRLKKANFLIVNTPENYNHDDEYDMELRPRLVYNGKNLSEQKTLLSFHGQKVHAVAGIGHPDRFFDMLNNYGIETISHPFPDHHTFKPEDIEFQDEYPVLMTEKDAVKCFGFMQPHHWVLSIDALVNPLFDAKLLNLLKESSYGQKTA